MLDEVPSEPGAARNETVMTVLRRRVTSVPQLATRSASEGESALGAAPNEPGVVGNEPGRAQPGTRKAWDMSEVMTWGPDALPESE